MWLIHSFGRLFQRQEGNDHIKVAFWSPTSRHDQLSFIAKLAQFFGFSFSFIAKLAHFLTLGCIFHQFDAWNFFQCHYKLYLCFPKNTSICWRFAGLDATRCFQVLPTDWCGFDKFSPERTFWREKCCKVAVVGEKEKRWPIKKLAMKAQYPEQLDRKDISLGQLVGW